MTYDEFINSLENKTEDSRPKYKKPQNYQPTHLNIHPTEYKTEETSKLEQAFYPCEECGGIGHTIGFLGSQKVVYPCEKGCAE